MMLEAFAIISAILVLASMPPYIIDIIKGKTKPERASWAIWSGLGIIAFVSSINLSAVWSLVFIGLDGAYNLLVFTLSLKNGAWGWTLLDKVAVAIAAIGVILSLILDQPLLALLGVVLADVAGTVLTFIKTFQEPESETTISWFLTGSAAVFSTLAVGKLDFALLLYPAYIAFANYIILVAQAGGRLRLKAQKA